MMSKHHLRDLPEGGVCAVKAERRSPRAAPAILSRDEPTVVCTDSPHIGVVPPERDNVSERLHALKSAMRDLSRDLADLTFPGFEAGPERLGRESPRAQIVEVRPSSAAGKPAGSKPAATPVHLGSNDAAAAVPVAQRPRRPWSPGAEPAILSPAEPPTARINSQRVHIVHPERGDLRTIRPRRLAWLWFIVGPFGLVGLGVALFMVLAGRVDVQGTQTRESAVEQAAVEQAAVEQNALRVDEPVATPRSSGLPLPSSYGVYAISQGSLHELGSLAFKAPDPRIKVSAEITKPSSTILPDGKIVFVVFRRELLSGSPQKATVRVIARVARTMTFDGGKATSTELQNSWRMRGNSYDFNVMPLSENREMVAIPPDSADLVLPAGRYALVFGGLAYDFTVDGLVTDRAQCLESVMASNGQVYTECRPK
jgi:hypothetical protein